METYVNVTLAFPWGGEGLEVGVCSELGYTTNVACPFSQPIDWAPAALMRPVCEAQCGCTYPDCEDTRDRWLAGQLCSMCGPRYNAPITLECYHQ